MTEVPTLSADRAALDRMTLTFEVQQFLFREAEMLDSWRLPEWLDLFVPEGEYLVPSTDKPDGDPREHLFLVQDDRFLLEQRINSLMKRSAHAEYPHSRTVRTVSNVLASEIEGDRVAVRANFIVNRSRNGIVDTYFGHYDHVLERSESSAFRFVIRKSVLALDALRPHGKVSIIL